MKCTITTVISVCVALTISLVTLNWLNSMMYFRPAQNFVYLETNPLDSISNEYLTQLLKQSLKDFNQPLEFFNNDKRITPTLYLDRINKILLDNQGVLPRQTKFEFSWIDWIDFDERLNPSKEFLENHNFKPIETCNEFSSLIGFPQKSSMSKHELNNCTDLTVQEINELSNPNYPHLKILAPLDNYEFTIESRIIHGALYTLHEMASPERMIFVDGTHKLSIVVPISNSGSTKKSVFTDTVDGTNGVEGLDQLPKISNIMTDILNNLELTTGEDMNLGMDTARVDTSHRNSDASFELSRSDFENPGNIDEIKSKLKNFDILHTYDSNLFKNINDVMLQYPKGDYPKYFHESRLNDDKIGGSHYDWRFFNIKEVDNEYKKLSVLNRMIRAWLRFTNAENIDTWLAHGTLLGYSFNQFMLPWDFDHDVQISSKSMWELAAKFNQSIVVDATVDDTNSHGYGQYFLDISSNFFNRSNDNGNNAIDGRFIDIHTGMYIDITQLSLIDKRMINQRFQDSGSKYIRDEFFRLLGQYDLNLDQLLRNEHDMIGCKNMHYYRIEEMTHFSKAFFEGENGYVPDTFELILDREFNRRRTDWNFEGYTWRNRFMRWVKDDQCGRGKGDREGASCLYNEYNAIIDRLMDIAPTSSSEVRPVYPDWERLVRIDRDGRAEINRVGEGSATSH